MAEIVQVDDDLVVAKGRFSQEVVDEVWMPIKKYKLVIPKSVTMTPPQFDAATGTSTFSFVVATNAVADSSIPGFIINGVKHNPGERDFLLQAYILNDAITHFVDALIAYRDGETPQEHAAAHEVMAYA